ncbi:hypothetical protein [Ornatilinea apprima]|uniref:hypothetical protein n=1 Tax=Ornatilinea apprima TaxID=1134406 RepID=UPI00094663AF|nr:hypothetical protein [Ornatilinea apprima]
MKNTLRILFSIVLTAALLLAGFPSLQSIHADSESAPPTANTNSTPIYTGFNENPGTAKEKLSTEFWFTWYDNKTMSSWIYIANPSSNQTASVEVYIGNTLRGTYSIAPGNVTNARYYSSGVGIQDGPVRVVSTNGVNILASQRVNFPDTSPTGYNEIMGFIAQDMGTEFWFPWYDNKTMLSWVLVGNPSQSQTAQVEIYVGNVLRGTYSIPPNGRVTPRFFENGGTSGTGLQDGPVRVVSTNGVTIFASERVHFKGAPQTGFSEVLGTPVGKMTTEYWFPWYDNKTMLSWVLVGNPSQSETAQVEIYVGNVLRGTYSVPPNGRVTPRFFENGGTSGTGLQDGPVRVVSTNGVTIFTSERVHFQTSPQTDFNEIMGLSPSQLSTEFWYPWYDNNSMLNWVLVGNPSSTETANVEIYIAGVLRGTYSIGPGARVTPRFFANGGTSGAGLVQGPVRVVSTNGVKVFSSERVHFAESVLVQSPPPPASSYYIKTVSPDAMFDLGCEKGTYDLNTPGKQDSLTILAFGKPRELSPGVYGARLYGPLGPVTNSQILEGVKAYGLGYKACVGSDTVSTLRVGLGTSNYVYPGEENQVTYGHGQAWAQLVNDTNQYFINTGLYGQVSFVGASDMELSWNSPSVTRGWVDGYDSRNQYPLYNFGAAEGCPTRLAPTYNCANGWQLEDVWYISYGNGASYPVPEIYATTGINARQWAWVSVHGYLAHQMPMYFTGVMTQYEACLQRGGCSGIDNTPAMGWQQMYDELNLDSRIAQNTLRWSTDIEWYGE